MTKIGALLEKIVRKIDPLRGFELLATLSRLHRAQGSEELVIAVEHTAQLLDELGIEHKVEVIRGPIGLHEHWGFYEPKGWRLKHGVIEARTGNGWKTIASTDDTPLVVIAGSPPGKAEGRPSLGAAGKGELLVTARFNKLKYYEAEEEGVPAVIAYHTGPGVRYYSIHHPLPLPKPRTPAVSIPLDSATRIAEEKPMVRVEVEAELHNMPPTPILYAWVGDGEKEALMIAHICHPRPGSHDNASGVAVAIEALAALKSEEDRLRERGLKVSLLLVPEWTGTAAAIQQGVIEAGNIVSAVSVDMVAANLTATGGALRTVSGPPPVLNPLDPLLDMALREVSVEGYSGISRYEMGSDHDVTLGMGIPSTMLNEWPDKYYHTSLDTPDNISVRRLHKIAAAIAAAHLALAEKLAEDRLKRLVEQAAAAAYPECSIAKEAASYIEAWIKGEQLIEPPEVRPPISTGYLYLQGLRKQAKHLVENKEEHVKLNTYMTVLAATGSRNKALQAVYCVHEAGLSREALETIEELTSKH